MHRICTKYAKNICRNMQIYAIYMQKYANICSTVCATEICKNMQKYAKYMHAICKNMQNMQSRFLYAEYAKICTPHFADGLGLGLHRREPLCIMIVPVSRRQLVSEAFPASRSRSPSAKWGMHIFAYFAYKNRDCIFCMFLHIACI
jgi:hypothetical protein